MPHKMWHGKARNKNANPMDLSPGVGGGRGGGCLPHPQRTSGISTDFLAAFFSPGGLKSLFEKVLAYKNTGNENANRMDFVFRTLSVFPADSWVYRTTPRHRGLFKAKRCLLSPACAHIACHGATKHPYTLTVARNSFSRPFPNKSSYPACALRFSGCGGGLGMARVDAYLMRTCPATRFFIYMKPAK
jgi:hypothetical protein